jgi:hypothetical protein
MIKTGIKPTIIVLLLLGVLTGLAAADTYLEPDELSSSKSGARQISCPIGTSDIYHANINPGQDIDWVKASVVSGNHVDVLLDTYALNGYVSLRAENPDNSIVQTYSISGRSGNGYVNGSPLSIRFKDDNLVSYNDYQFITIRRTQ